MSGRRVSVKNKEVISPMDNELEKKDMQCNETECEEAPSILEEITVEEMAVDGICGIY
jgi:mycofactocin precursor